MSLMHDLHDLPGANLELDPQGDTYSLYSLGILLGIFVVAVDLVIATFAAVNVAIASHLSLHPPRKESNFESHFEWRLIFCMIMQCGIAIVSGVSLILLSFNINLAFSLCVGTSLAYGFLFLGYFVCWQSFGFNAVECMLKAPLSALSLALSTLAFILNVSLRHKDTTWPTVLAYYLTLTCHSFIYSHRIPLEKPHRINVGLSIACCGSWISVVIPLYYNNMDSAEITVMAVSGLEAIVLGYIGITGMWKRRHRPHIRGPISPV